MAVSTTIESALSKPALAKIDQIIAKHRDRPGALLPVLHELQAELRYLPEEALVRTAIGLSVPLSKVYGVASFYTLFNLRPKARHIVRVCESAPCHVRGAREVIEALEKAAGARLGEDSGDGRFTLEVTSCIGVCGVAPAVMVDEEVFGNLTPDMIPEILARFK
ncbi:MAG TPA: NAD(P)H-dependent oxidoreductase subunit E [Bacillota bacterium]